MIKEWVLRKGFCAVLCSFMLASICGKARAWAPAGDTGNSIVIVEPANGFNPQDNKTPFLFVDCEDGAVSIAVVYNQTVGKDAVSATLEFGGSGPMQRSDYEPAANGMGFYLANGSLPGSDDTVNSLLSLFSLVSDQAPQGSRILTITVYPTNQGSQTAVFDVAGFDDAYAPVGAACNAPIPTD